MDEQPGYVGRLVDGIGDFFTAVGDYTINIVGGVATAVENVIGSAQEVASAPGAVASTAKTTISLIPWIVVALVATAIYIAVKNPNLLNPRGAA